MTIPRIGSRDIEQLHRSLEADVPHVRASEKHRATRPYDARDASHADPSRAYDMSALDAAATAAETSNTQEAYSTLMKEILRLEVSAVENHEAARYWAYQATAYIFYKDLKSAVDCGVQSYYLDQTCAALGLELKVRVALKILESKPQEAIALLEPVLRIRPNHREALEGLVKALHQMGPKKQESKMAALQNLRDRYRDDSRLLELMDAVEMGEDFDRLRHCLHEAQKILRDGPLEPHEANAKQPVRLLNEAHCIAKDKGASGRTQGLLWRWSAIANFQFGKFEDAKRHFLMATKLDAETTEYISKTPAVTTATVIDPDFLPHSLVSAFIKLMHSWKIDQQNGHLEEWRAKIKEGDAVDVWSQSHGAWVKGEVEATDGEVLTLQKLRHDRLVTMIGAISDSPNLIMVLEYMAGGSLYTLLHVDKEVLSPSRKQMLSTDMASGVTFLHDFKPPAVHRDLKSMNVVLDGSRQRCKICDFGLTQTMEKTHITRKDQEGGSPRYMCPELFDPKTKITEKVDVWALGCLIAETFTGRLPHQECQSLPQVMNKLLVQKQGPFSSPAPLVISGHKQLIDEIFAALELEVERRTTARKLLKALTLA
eukprot:GEMP01008452.1.p1 GENE.GEMP01008452.1~~GEMP01008452.1.p1  ORF type:complete len:598 (+),score=159.43 GEMP01008452.1:443-2236(+)